MGIAASLGVAGCAEFQEAKIELRNRYLAKEAWRSLRETHGAMNYEKDFGRGFREGYHNVASGGLGCPPVLPPQRYWSVRYMNMEGRARTEAWFAGFRYGAMVAEQDGVGLFMELPTSLPDQSTRRRIPLPPELSEPDEEAAPETSAGESAPAPEESSVQPSPDA
jgi:hypothetical protein